MENEKSKLPNLSEFLDIYPPIINTQNNISDINDSKKFFVYFEPIKDKNQKNLEKLKNHKQSTTSISYPILLEKILKQQKNKADRTQEAKEAIKNFLYHSDLIQKLNSYFSTQKNDNDNNLGNLEEQINTVINKLAENVVLEKYDENKKLIKYGDFGHNCYFLLSGKISVLKPVEYNGINISYHDYIKYLSNLFKNKEKYLLLKIIELNNKSFFQFHNLEQIKQDINKIKSFIKSYCIILLYSKLQSGLIECNDIPKIIEELKEFNLSLKDFNLDEEEIEENINNINQENFENKSDKFSIAKSLKKYILKIFAPSEDDKYNMKPYETLLLKNDNKDINNNNLATLYKYDLFLYSGPGSFFGEMALEKNSPNKKRNATIRTEEECFMFSLTQKLYNWILVSTINLIKEYDISFLQRNYFFNGISVKIFDKFYFPMFKILSKEKNEIIHKQNDLINSIYFLKEGKIKLEICLSIIDIYNLIRYYIQYLSENRRHFNFLDEEIYELNKNYLDHDDELYFGNKPPIFKDKINEIKKYELFNVTNNEAIGLLEFMSSQGKYITSYVVISKNAKLFEINQKNLEIIIKREKDIKNDYYKFAKNKFLIMIKRLHSIKYNCLSNIFYKINQNFFGELSQNDNNKNEQYDDEEKNGAEEEEDEEEKEDKYKDEFDNKDINIYDSQKRTDNNTNINITNINNSNKYENLHTSPKNTLVKIKKLNLPYTNRANYHQIDYNRRKGIKNHYSEFSFRSIKFNENYFIKNRHNYISKVHDNNSNKAKFNASYLNFLNTLLSPGSKKNLLETNQRQLKLKKINYRSSNIISIGKNKFFTLEQLKSKFKEKGIDKNLLDLSIVKNENKKYQKYPLLNYEGDKFNSFIFQKNYLSPNNFHNKKFKKIMFLHNESSNNFSDTNSSLNLAINSNNNDIIKIKKYQKIDIN